MSYWKDIPLCKINFYDPSYKVESCLHSYLRQNVYSEREVMLEIFSLCSQLELMLTTFFFNQIGSHEKVCFGTNFDMQAKMKFQAMKTHLALLKDKSSTLESFLKRKGMYNIFPNVCAYLSHANGYIINIKDQKSVVKKYFEQLTYLNQLYAISEQINEDLYQQFNHKYIAHQTVLLHNAVSFFGTPLEDHKDEIESIFLDIKAHLKLQTNEIPHLEHNERNRLDEVTRVLMKLSSEIHPMLSSPLTPIVNFIAKDR
ncbi:uncharacterized protein LOC100212423 isoform X3 [Hydra vulgaris]|uniref:Uncharacterized protein LOC100212423 isoform X3 n=2 Tax=Hydra vulgaris TaxID=6087 RepID=A0ABM4B6P6_HYDVU